MSPLRDMRRRLLANPEVQLAYDELLFREEIGHLLEAARDRARLTQAELAAMARTRQSVIARLETGHGGVPSLPLLDRVAFALGLRLTLKLEPRLAH